MTRENTGWEREVFAADGSVDFAAAVKLWAERLRQVEAGEDRMRYRDRQLHIVADGLSQANKIEDPLEAYRAASLILTRAWTVAATGDGARAEPRMPTVQGMREVMMAVFRAAEEPSKAIPTGFPKVDEMLAGGPRPGELVYIGARPGVGKSAFALEMARAAAEAGKRVLIVSREMLAVALGRRMIAQAGRLSATAIRRADLSIWPAVVKTADALSNLPIHICDDAQSVADLGWLCSAAMLRPPDLLIVDYLQLLAPPPGTSGERRHQVEAVSAALKAFALRREIPVVCLSSLARPGHGEDGKEKAPTLGSFRESGQIEHDADMAIFLHRHRGESDCDCILAKVRDGESGVVQLHFSADCVSFAEASRRVEENHASDWHNREES